jgi:hypothetical protein
MGPPEPPIQRLDRAAARRQWARLLARVRQRQARVRSNTTVFPWPLSSIPTT